MISSPLAAGLARGQNSIKFPNDALLGSGLPAWQALLWHSRILTRIDHHYPPESENFGHVHWAGLSLNFCVLNS
jgi:hypothetical protein